MTLRFPRQWRTASYLPPSPEDGHRPVHMRVELRRDPLTGRSGRVAHFQGFRLRRADLSAAVAASRPHCPFCDGRIAALTPRLEAAVAAEGRIEEGEAVLFPNISPYDRRSAVVVMAKDHYLAPEDIRPHHLTAALRAAQRYLAAPRVLRRRDYGLVTWNYMPLAGATQIHPHLQVFATDRPGTFLEEENRASRAFRRRSGENFWELLVSEERRRGERWVGAGAHTAWMTAFVSRSVVSDLLTVFPGQGELGQLSGAALQEFGVGISAALQLLAQEGVVSFNLALYPAPAGEADPALRLHARLSPRIHFSPQLGGTDATVWQHLLDEPFMVRSPERLAEVLRQGVSQALSLS